MRSSPHLQEDPEPGFQIAPMVDVVFVLMLFFMAFAGYKQQELVMDVKLPSPGGRPGHASIILEIGSDGAVFVNNQPMGSAADPKLKELTKWVRNLRETFGDDDSLIIRPAPSVKHERVIQVLDALAAANWHKLAFN